MIGFIGQYESTIDAKGRFLLPSGFKKQLPEQENYVFVINMGIEKCLVLYPIQSWEPVFNKVIQLNDFDPEVRDFRRQFLNGALKIELDSAGRLLIPKNLLEYASLDKDIIMAAAGDKMEIWDKNERHKQMSGMTAEAYSKLANKVMNRSDNKQAADGQA